MDYKITLRLSHLVDVKVTEMEDDNGRMEEGIFIPFKKNRIFKGKKSITLSLIAKEKKMNTWGMSHFLVPYWGKMDEVNKRIEMYGQVPFVGSVTPTRFSRKKILPYSNVADKDYLAEMLNKDE